MADASIKEATTNPTPKSRVDVKCDCETMWSMAQNFSTRRLCVDAGKHKGKLITDYAVRARRIAATYARFYLEMEAGGDPTKIGRYYWMALGAFASKTVACTFEAWQVQAMSVATKTVWEGLGKGNLWLFCDISGWHWYHSNYPASFEKCLERRDARKYVQNVKQQVARLPWNATALPVIKHFAPSSEIRNGFAKLKEFEAATDPTDKQKYQLEHLLEIANHEQGIILQPLIYDDSAFAFWVKQQRSAYAQWASPTLQLIFTHQCDNVHTEVKSLAPQSTKLESFASRMAWIDSAARKFHKLMMTKKEFMHGVIAIMATWADLSDSGTNGTDNG